MVLGLQERAALVVGLPSTRIVRCQLPKIACCSSWSISKRIRSKSRMDDHVWLTPRQNQSVDLCAVAGATHNVSPIVRRAEPLARGSGEAPGRANQRGCRRRRPPFCHDGTERRIPRPKDPDEQKSCYSGKKKCHTVKNVLLVTAALIIVFLSDTYEGSAHDKRIADATPYPLPAGSRLMQDLGFLAFTLDGVETIMPTKKPRGGSLPMRRKRKTSRLPADECGSNTSTVVSSDAVLSRTPFVSFVTMHAIWLPKSLVHFITFVFGSLHETDDLIEIKSFVCRLSNT